MSLPHQSDQQLVQYLLGLLPDTEAERLDEAAIADDEVALRLRLVENDLVDGYVRGTLEPETRARFESHYLASPRRREAVRFAASFVRAVDRAAARADRDDGGGGSTAFATARESETDTERAPRRMLVFRPRLALAALALVACGALLFEATELVRGTRPAPSSAAAGQTAVEAGRVASAPQAAPLVLFAQTRAIGSIPTLVLPAGRGSATFELRLESNEFSQYQAGLRDPATNQIVWRSGWLAADSSGTKMSVAVAVPARVLAPQHYTLDLSGRTATGSADVVGSYAFQIAPR